MYCIIPRRQSKCLFLSKKEQCRERETNAGPGDIVVWVNRVTEAPWLTDGAFEGLARAALGLYSKRTTNWLISTFLTKEPQMSAKHCCLSYTFTQINTKQTSCDVLSRKFHLNTAGKMQSGIQRIFGMVIGSSKTSNQVCRVHEAVGA